MLLFLLQLFLTVGAIFVVVWSARTDKDGLDEVWPSLNNCQGFGP